MINAGKAKNGLIISTFGAILIFALISASFAKSVRGDETVVATSTPDLATIPVLDTTNNALVRELAASSTVSSSVVDTTQNTSEIYSTDAPASINNATSSDIIQDKSVSEDSDTSLSGGDQIHTYKVQDGDTISQIAEKFNISVNTIVWANNITAKMPIKVGQTLVILPITGVEYTVKSGDNLQSIANSFKGDIDEIAQFNNLKDSDSLKIGDIVIIPHGEATVKASSNPKPPVKTTSKPTVIATNNSASESTPNVSNKEESSNGFMRPISGGVKTQGIHGNNGVDLASSLNTPIMASAAGDVIVAKTGGWNGGYGNYVVINHPNGLQTLYAHMNSVSANIGDHVSQGEVIGYMGNTGDSTGVHLHFEVRGGVNPF